MTDIDRIVIGNAITRILLRAAGTPGMSVERFRRILVALIAADLCAPDPPGRCELRNPDTITFGGSFAVVRGTDDALIRAFRAAR